MSILQEEQFHQRAPQEYDFHSSLLNGLYASDNSTTYGLNYSSPLSEMHYFHVVNGQLLQDIIHTLFEGVLPKEIQLMLQHFVFVVILDLFNARLLHFVYGRSDLKNKPPKAFEDYHIRGTTKLSLFEVNNSD